MRLDGSELEISLFGGVSFLSNKKPLQFATRKAQALFTFLAANAGTSFDRKWLSGLLWSNFEESAARVSLRQAVSLLCNERATATRIGRDRSTITFIGDPAQIDLTIFHQAIAKRTEAGYRAALSLWRGELLMGAEIGEPAFDDWVHDFRLTTTARIHRLLCDELDQPQGVPLDTATQVALCELISAIEPADIQATERLMEIHSGRGDPAAAIRCFRRLEAALGDLDVAVPERLSEIAAKLRGAVGVSEPVLEPRRLSHHGVPTVILQRPSGMPAGSDQFAYAHSEVMCQLTRFHSMRCFEPLPALSEETRDTKCSIKLEEEGKHDYRILLWNEPNARSLYLRCVNAHRMDTVSCMRLGYDELADRAASERIIASAVNTIEQDILNDSSVQQDSPYARWLVALKHLQLFTADSDRIAYQILSELAEDPHGSRLSLVHASMGSVVMKRRLYSPTDLNGDDDIRRAKVSVERALALDPHDPFNQVISGWWSIQTQAHDRALASFDNALALNPFSSRVLISAAEAHAFCGDIAGARTLANRALEFSGCYAPPYFYSYLAAIAYLAGDLDDCLLRLHRAPENLHTLLLAIAAHQERGDMAQVAAARARLESELRQAPAERQFDRNALANWIVGSNMSRDATARRRMFGALEHAGVPVATELA